MGILIRDVRGARAREQRSAGALGAGTARVDVEVSQSGVRNVKVVVEVAGVTYLSSSYIAEELGVSRQTLWRWRQQDKIPKGHRFRDRWVLFTKDEAVEIRNYANRVEPISSPNTES